MSNKMSAEEFKSRYPVNLPTHSGGWPSGFEYPNRQLKMRNHRVYAYDQWWDSKGELNRYEQLLLLERSGNISSLSPKMEFVLVDQDKTNRISKSSWRPDFYYREKGQTVVEDFKAKPSKTALYQLKVKLFKVRYPHIIVRESFKDGSVVEV